MIVPLPCGQRDTANENSPSTNKLFSKGEIVTSKFSCHKMSRVEYLLIVCVTCKEKLSFGRTRSHVPPKSELRIKASVIE